MDSHRNSPHTGSEESHERQGCTPEAGLALEMAPLPADCVVLAAGLSSRMGQWKMQLPLGDQRQGLRTILDHSLANALGACQRVIMVTGHRANELHSRYQNRNNLTLVNNAAFKTGLTSSVLCGLEQAKSEFVFITHGDMPFLNRALFNHLWQYRGDQAVFPEYQGQHGHPVLIPATMIPGLLNEEPSRTMKQLLKKSSIHVSVTSPEITRDIDTPEAYLAETGISLSSP